MSVHLFWPDAWRERSGSRVLHWELGEEMPLLLVCKKTCQNTDLKKNENLNQKESEKKKTDPTNHVLILNFSWLKLRQEKEGSMEGN